MKTSRLLPLYALIGIIMFVAGGWYFSTTSAPVADKDTGGVGGAFELQNGQQQTLTESFFHGKPYAMMFGFTHCPDICPTGLTRMKRWQDALGERHEAMRFAFVTVDPTRDTPAVLGRYVAYFSDSIVPLSGSPKNIEAMLKAYHVYAQKVPLDGGSYTMDHHSAVFLFDAQGRFSGFIYYTDTSEEAMQKLQQLLDAADSWTARLRRLIGA